MKTCYVMRLGPIHGAIADLIKPGEITPSWTISRINVPEEYRGHGYGSELLRMILDDADLEQVALELEVEPSGPLNYHDLQAWYERYGFVRQSNGYMKRRPRKP